MACINMFNPDHQGRYGGGGAAAPPPMSPRISFSNDFVLDAATGCPAVRYERSPPGAASPASDFEFSVESYGMMTADELFFKGRLLPLKEHCAAAQMQRMTLRDELLAGDDDEDGLTFSPSSSSSRVPGKVSLRWKTLLGLRKAHPSAGKKHDKKQEKQLHQEDAGEEEEEEDVSASNTSSDNASCHQDRKDEGRDVEIGL